MSRKTKTGSGKHGDYVPLSEAIKALGKLAEHISRPTIQRALREGLMEHKRTSLNSKARFRVRVNALRDYLERLNND